MGKGDRKTAKGKRSISSYGVSRPHGEKKPSSVKRSRRRRRRPWSRRPRRRARRESLIRSTARSSARRADGKTNPRCAAVRVPGAHALQAKVVARGAGDVDEWRADRRPSSTTPPAARFASVRNPRACRRAVDRDPRGRARAPHAAWRRAVFFRRQSEQGAARLIASRSESRARCGIASVATAIATPCARNASIGGSFVSRRHR